MATLAIKTEPTFEVTEEAIYSNRSQGSDCYHGRGRSGGGFGLKTLDVTVMHEIQVVLLMKVKKR